MQQTAKKHVGHGFSQFKLTNYLLNNLSQFDITPTAKLVLLELSACYNPNKPDMFPKQKTLASKIGVSERSVVRAIQELFKAGLIIIECKYTNRYKFTSKIVKEPLQNENFFKAEKVSDDLSQNDRKKGDKFSPHEPTKELIKEPVNVEDFKILKDYAESKGAKNVKAYIEALKRNGSAQAIIADYKVVQSSKKWHEKQSNETMHNIEEVRNLETASYEDCQKLKDVLFKNWGVKKA